MPSKPYWETKTLRQMTVAEWEGLCDGCGLCCLIRFEDEDTGEITLSNAACRLLCLDTNRCGDYANRKARVPDCVGLTPRVLRNIDWLPPTCGYRRVAEGKDLAWWHPLVSGDPTTVHTAGISVRGRAVSERCAGTLESHIVDWPGRVPRPRRPTKETPTKE